MSFAPAPDRLAPERTSRMRGNLRPISLLRSRKGQPLPLRGEPVDGILP
jgi:hypothetical protein